MTRANQSLTLGTTEDLRVFSVENVGGDFLSLDGLSVDNPAVVTARALDAPPDGCIPPRGSVNVEVDRVSAQTASATVTVATTPAASPPSSGKVASPLDLEGTVIQHELRGPTDTPGPHRRALVQFDGKAFGDNSMLRPFAVEGRPLRVLTRAKTPDEPVDRLRFYRGLRSPVWNNTGDTARIINEFGEVVDTFDYVTSYAADGSTPAGTHVVLPAAKHRVATRRVFVDARTDWTTVFSVLDGDLLHVRDVTGTISLGGFFGSSGTSGPNGRPGTSAPDDSPCPGAPNFSLIGCIGYVDGDGAVKPVVPPFFVGSDRVVTVTVDQTGLTFFLGVNDSVLSDNGGEFDAAVDLTR